MPLVGEVVLRCRPRVRGAPSISSAPPITPSAAGLGW